MAMQFKPVNERDYSQTVLCGYAFLFLVLKH